MAANLVGRTLGNYRVLERLGQGKDAVVYRAQQRNLGRMVTLKVVAAANAEGQERLRRESKLVAKLQHPGIREVIGIEAATVQDGPPGAAVGPTSGPDVSGRYVFAVLEYAEQSLKSEMVERQQKGATFTLREVTAILRPIAEVLDYLASMGISHMDVKPENILLTSVRPDAGQTRRHAADAGRIMLSDFGVAQSFGQAMSRGTPAYVAPEVLASPAQVSAGTDVYSLGVVAFEMLAGELPFKGDNPTTLYYAHTHTPAPMLDRVNRKCKNSEAWVIKQALAKEPTARYVSAGAFITALERAETLSVRLTTWPKRKPRTAAASAVGLLGVAVVAAMGLMQMPVRLPGGTLPRAAAPPTEISTTAPAAQRAPLVDAGAAAETQVVAPTRPPASPSEPTATGAPSATARPTAPATVSPTTPAAAVAPTRTVAPDQAQCPDGDAIQSVAIYSPQANAKLKRGAIEVRGVADFQQGSQVQVHYEVRVSPVSNAEAGQNTVIRRAERRQPGILGSWDASAAAPGLYMLQLRAVLNDGNYKVCNVPVTLE